MINHKPAKTNLPVLTQLCKLIPSHLTASLAKKYGIDKQARYIPTGCCSAPS
jgi:hypothetical protein